MGVKNNNTEAAVPLDRKVNGVTLFDGNERVSENRSTLKLLESVTERQAGPGPKFEGIDRVPRASDRRNGAIKLRGGGRKFFHGQESSKKMVR